MTRRTSFVAPVVALLLTLSVLFTETAHAARPPRRLAAMLQQQADPQQASPQQETPAPVLRQTPAPQPRPVDAPGSSNLPPEAYAQQRLEAARNIFIDNAGADDAFPADPNAGFHGFLAQMQAWGRYNIVNDVAQADIVLQLRSGVTTTVVDGTRDSPSTTVYHNPYFKLTVADPATLMPMWTIAVPVVTGIRRKDKADYFALSVENVVTQIKVLTNVPLNQQEQATLHIADGGRHGHMGLWLGLGALGLILATAVVVPIVMHNHFEDDVQKQNEQQMQFCQQNHIPASYCPV